MSILPPVIDLELANRARRSAFCAATCMALIMWGCTTSITTIPRMNSNFNAQSVGAPQQFPTPSPPGDQFIWLTQQPLISVVASNPSGGNWVLTVPKPVFLADPDLLHQFLLAGSEPFTTSPPVQMNGQFSVQLLGPGKVSFGIRATRGSAAGFVGGGELSASPFGGGDIGTLLNPSAIDNLAAFDRTDFPVTALGLYNPGHLAHFLYSIDQASHTFNLSFGVVGGATGNRSANYSFSGPIEKLELWLFLRQPASNTKVFVNEVTMDEIQ